MPSESGPGPASAPAGSSPPAIPGPREPLLTFLAATAVAAALFWLGRVVPFVYQNLHGLIAVVFLHAPWLASRASGQPFDYRDAGVRVGDVGRGLATLGLVLLITWPPFIAGFFLFYDRACGMALAQTAPPAVDWWVQVFAPICPRWLGFDGTPLRWPPGTLTLAASQLVVVALPEELLFRGYLYQRFESLWPSRRRFLGATVGWPLLVTSGLFALGHVLVDLDPRRFAVFFPGLAFAWMRARSGSILPGAIYHAACNLLSEVLHETFFA